MPQVEISIGGRSFEVACQEGEESFLHSAAKMLDDEAQHISSQVGRMPEARMLLMAGLMLADKTAGLEEKLAASESRQAALQARIDELESGKAAAAPVPAAKVADVAVLPEGLTKSLTDIAARAEAIAGEVERRAS